MYLFSLYFFQTIETTRPDHPHNTPLYHPVATIISSAMTDFGNSTIRHNMEIELINCKIIDVIAVIMGNAVVNLGDGISQDHCLLFSDQNLTSVKKTIVLKIINTRSYSIKVSVAQRSTSPVHNVLY